MPDVDEFEEVVVRLSPRPTVILGSSVSPDGRFGAVLTLIPSADYVLNELYEHTPDGWVSYISGNGDVTWRSLGEYSRGVLAFGGEAPESASAARVVYEGGEYVVPIRHGHFFYVHWDTDYHEEPRLVGFE
jgi:hypothetical protein